MGISSISDAWHWNISRLAEGFDLDRATVRKRLTAANVQPVGKKGTANLYLLSEAAAAVFAPPDAGDDLADLDPDGLDPTKRKHWYEGEDTRLDVAVKKGWLIPVEEVREDRAELMKALVGFFEGGVDKMERTRLFDAEQLEQLEQLFDGLRADLHNQLAVVDE